VKLEARLREGVGLCARLLPVLRGVHEDGRQTVPAPQ
jgi:hypothetical protein